MLCFKLAQMTPWAKMSWSWNFWSLRKMWTNRQTQSQTRFMFYKYRLLQLNIVLVRNSFLNSKCTAQKRIVTQLCMYILNTWIDQSYNNTICIGRTIDYPSNEWLILCIQSISRTQEFVEWPIPAQSKSHKLYVHCKNKMWNDVIIM